MRGLEFHDSKMSQKEVTHLPVVVSVHFIECLLNVWISIQQYPICHGEVFCLKAKKYRYNHKIMPRQFTKCIFSFNTKTVNFLKIKILIYNLYGSIGVLQLYFLKIKVPFLFSYNISERNLSVMRSLLVHIWRLDTA